MTLIRYVSPILVAVVISGCATVTRGTNADVVIATEPPGATAYAVQDGERIATCEPTPCSFEVSRRANFDLVIELSGYQSATIPVDSNVSLTGSAAGAANVAASGAAGASVISTAATAGSVGGAFSTIGSGLMLGGHGFGFLGVDLLSGALLAHSPNPVGVKLFTETTQVPEAYIEFGAAPLANADLSDEESEAARPDFSYVLESDRGGDAEAGVEKR